jgi:uncharacterized lipoprotein
MTGFRLAIGIVLVMGLAACSKDVDMTCDEVRVYQLAVEGERVKAPEGLDDLDPLKEVQLPKASPRAERPPGSACVDRPPKVKLGT